MTRTLANMTPAEQAECVGMWADIADQEGIIRDVWDSVDGVRVKLMLPVMDCFSYFTMPDKVTPRFDLPRAWTPDGQPVPGVWQYHPAYTGVYQDGTTSLNLIGAETYSKQLAEGECADIHRDDPAVRFFPVRRYATDWEEA